MNCNYILNLLNNLAIDVLLSLLFRPYLNYSFIVIICHALTLTSHFTLCVCNWFRCIFNSACLCNVNESVMLRFREKLNPE